MKKLSKEDLSLDKQEVSNLSGNSSTKDETGTPCNWTDITYCGCESKYPNCPTQACTDSRFEICCAVSIEDTCPEKCPVVQSKDFCPVTNDSLCDACSDGCSNAETCTCPFPETRGCPVPETQLCYCLLFLGYFIHLFCEILI